MLAVGGTDAGACLRALRPLAVGETVVRADFEAAACDDAGAGLGYDRVQRVARVRRPISAGEVVRGSASTLAAVRPGERLTLEARIGAVAVERTVEVLRAARMGAAVVVRGPDGAVFVAPPVEAETRP